MRLDEEIAHEHRTLDTEIRLARGTGEHHRLISADELDCLVHDLRGPVLAMEHELALCERELHPVARRSLAAVRGNLEFLKRLLHDAALTSRPEQREASTVSLSALVHAVVARAPEPAQDRCYVEEVGRTNVRVDPTRLERVIANLLDNALRYTEGAIVIRLERAGAMGRLSVIDGGPGMSEDVAACVFERGRRGDDGGEGLGLHVARTIVESYGGRIGVETRPDAGARFFFELAAVASESSASVRARPVAASSVLCGASVLLVDDDLHQLRALAEILRSEHISVVTATSAPECLVRVMAQRPEVVVLDLNVAGSDPLTLARGLNAIDPSLPVILATGMPADHPTVRLMLEATRGGFLPKPFGPGELFVVLEQALMAPRRAR